MVYGLYLEPPRISIPSCLFLVPPLPITFQVELLRTPQAARLGVDLIVAKTANDGMHGI